MFVTACVLAAGLLIMFAIKKLGILRISPEGELAGLDITEHGAPAYHPEPSYDGYSPIPAGAPNVSVGLPGTAGAATAPSTVPVGAGAETT